MAGIESSSSSFEKILCKVAQGEEFQLKSARNEAILQQLDLLRVNSAEMEEIFVNIKTEVSVYQVSYDNCLLDILVIGSCHCHKAFKR